MDNTNKSLNWSQSTFEMTGNSIQSDETANQSNTVETFCNTPHPTAKQFDALPDTDKLLAFRDYLKVCFQLNFRTMSVVFVLLKISYH